MIKSVLYIKKFENGGVYIGITCNFLRRMGKHRYDAKHGSKLPVHRAMMKYKYEDEILCESKTIKYISPNSKVLCKTLNEARDTLRKWKYMIFKNNSYILVDKLNLNFGITYREYVNLKVKSRVKNGEEVCMGCYKIREIKAK